MAPRLLLLVAVTVGLTAPQVVAQQSDRRSREAPEIMVEAGGRSGTCDALLFSPDGRFLFAAGDDKVVRVWPYAPTGLDTDPAKTQTLRWRAWREQRGGIKAVALSPDGKFVAVGGYGMKPSTVALIDRDTGDTVTLTWPKSRSGIDNFNTVTAVAFHPDGRRIGFGTADGSLWLWEPTKLPQPDADDRPSKAPVRVGKHEVFKDEKGRDKFNLPRLLYFPDANTLVSAAESGQVVACDLTGKFADIPADPPPATTLLFRAAAGPPDKVRLFRAERVGTTLVFALTSPQPQVVLRPDGAKPVTIDLPEDHFPRSIAVHPKTGQLAVGVGAALPAKAGQPRFYAEGDDEIWLYDNPTAAGAKPTRLKHTGRVEALAFHPTDARLVAAGGDADEVTLLNPAKPEKPLTVIRGAGRRLWGVGISENGRVIGVRTGRDATSTDPNARGTGAWTRFDLSRLQPTLDESQKWVGPVTSIDRWAVVPDKNDRFVWKAVFLRNEVENAAEMVTYPIPWDRDRDQAPTCYTFLPARDGKPTRLLVGHYYGCSLFECTRDGVKRVKIFTGHAGEVTSIVADPKQQWFVTAGTDQTVAVWSLADWQGQSGLGAAFRVNAGAVEVTAVDIGSPAWEAGLQVGDVIDLLAVDGKRPPVYDRRAGQTPAGNPETAVKALTNPQSGIELFFGRVPKGNLARKETLTTVRQRPLWKWLPGYDDRGKHTEWVVWMWHGSYYHTKTAHGDRLVGWHVNSPDVGGRPAFFRLDQFEKLFHRQEVIEKLVNTREVGAALIDAQGDNPLPMSFGQYEHAPVRIGVSQSMVGPAGVGVTVTARPRGSNPDLLPTRVELWVNDHRLKVWPAPGAQPLNPNAPFEQVVNVPAEAFRAGDNQLTVLTFNPAGGRGEDRTVVTNPKLAPAPALLGLSVGIDDYKANRQSAAQGKRAGFNDLVSARKDAQGVSDGLLAYSGPGKYFPAGGIDLRLDADATRKKLLADLAALAHKARPDDLLVVFFAGHGFLDAPPVPGGAARPGGRGVVAGAGAFVFCCPDFNPLKVADTALTAEELFDALAAVNCRKVVLLDACHSGQAADANVLRRLIPAGQGPFVIAACDQSELSYEHPKFGHGLFTYSVLEALGSNFRSADADSDGVLSPTELYAYVSERVPALMKQIRPGDTQNPICFPRQPPRYALVAK